MQYLIYRHGANANNQRGEDRSPVAIVDAPSAAEAVECEPREVTVSEPARLRLAPHVTLWANQWAKAVAVAHAPRADVQAATERQSIDA